MSKQSPNLQKLKILHHQKLNCGLSEIALVANGSVVTDSPDEEIPKKDTKPTSSATLIQKAEEFCRKTRVVANKCKVFVGNVSYRVKSRELKEFFTSFGKVIYAQIITDRMKKRSRGFGFVTFSNEWEAQKAKDSSDDERTLEGRVMKVCTPERRKKGSKNFIQESTIEEALESYRENGNDKKEAGEEAMESCDCTISGSNELRPEIFKLNEYTMLHIFLYLSPKDRIRIERVCRRWRLLAIKSWHRITHLDFQGVFTSFKGMGGLTDEVLWSILRRGCQNLTSLDLSQSPHFLTEFAVLCIGKQCKLLTELDLSGVKVSTSSLKNLSQSCKQLEKITLHRCHRVGEKALWWLFKNCQKLRHVNLEGNKSVRGQCFFMLPPACENLYLKDCTQLTDKGMIYIGDKCKNLRIINVSGCITLTDEGVLQLTQHCCMIESLVFSQAGNNVTSQGLQNIANLSLLKELDLSKNAVVNDELLFSIGRSCIHLKFLNLDSCEGEITDAGLQCLISCYQLFSLVISYLTRITDESVIHLSSNGTLERLVARACPGLTDKSIESLLQSCGQLTILDVSGCSGITNASLELLSLHCISEDRPVINCTVGGTAIDEEAITRFRETSYRCFVFCIDYSVNPRIDAVPSHGSGAFFREEDDDEFDEFDDEFDDEDEEEHEHFHNIVDDEETWMAEDSLWWRPGDAEDFLEADYPSLLAEQLYRS
ncbi:F-box/LRR-repeat protein fbxl-1-like isoform X2 [Pocillopora verrucosa]|uniref:F-box/LRR-repeat protein fbxl-1-like isoform X2 n=1 Tax=Pocillopora verrucosa TaxID=203993 RepID=UPI003341B98D